MWVSSQHRFPYFTSFLPRFYSLKNLWRSIVHWLHSRASPTQKGSKKATSFAQELLMSILFQHRGDYSLCQCTRKLGFRTNAIPCDKCKHCKTTWKRNLLRSINGTDQEENKDKYCTSPVKTCDHHAWHSSSCIHTSNLCHWCGQQLPQHTESNKHWKVALARCITF